MSKFSISTLFVLICALCGGEIDAQISTADLAITKSICNSTAESQTNIVHKKGFFLFSLYKLFISSQDIPNVCRFHPSCSEYGLNQVNKKGWFVGSLATFDRLSRCDGRQTEQLYAYDRNRTRFLDWP